MLLWRDQYKNKYEPSTQELLAKVVWYSTFPFYTDSVSFVA